MADFAEPPAKKARLDVDAPGSGPLNLDAPGSPVDDLDDDFYETTAADVAVAAAEKGDAPSSSTVSAEPASAAASRIPGLGRWLEPSAQLEQALAQPGPPSLHVEALEDGELSDAEFFYADVKPEASVTQQQQQQQQQQQVADGASQQNGDASKSLKRKASPLGTLDTLDATHAAAPPTPVTKDDSTHTKQEDDSKVEFLQAAAANKDNKDAEWQLDSEASSSDSSSSSSSDHSSSEEDGEASDGELLSPEEAIKRMLEEDPDDDDAAASKTTKVKTQNEVDEAFVKPDIKMTPDTKITTLGPVESIVENMVVIKAKVSGDYHVLESGSALCLADRTVIGQVSETIGRVQDPRYSVGFADAAEIAALGITKDTPIYYVDEHSSFVFTEPLRNQKHTDASGQYDEETRVEEFSDDEQEAEHKRKLKQQKKQRIKDADDFEFKPPTGPAAYRQRSPPASYTGGGLKYSDDEDEDLGMYKPLARPDRFEDIVGAGAPLEDRSHVRRGMIRGGRGGWMDRGGRGFRGRGGGGRGDRGGMGGGHRGDRGDRGGIGGHRGDRGGMGGSGGRGDRGGRPFRGSPERPMRHQEQNRSRNGPPQQDHRNHPRAQFSPAGSPPQQDPNRSQPQPSPRSKKRNKKRNRRDRERSAQPPAAANANAFASNNTQSTSGWNATAPSTSYAPPTTTTPAYAPENYYANPGLFSQQAQAPAPAPVPAPVPAQNQANQVAWAQWLQMAAYLQQAQVQPQQPQAPPPAPPPQQQPQLQTQYTGYQYQQYQQQQQNMTPPADPRRQNHNAAAGSAQASNQTLQDILRVLGNQPGA